jgi:hyperosmotically inducible protein
MRRSDVVGADGLPSPVVYRISKVVAPEPSVFNRKGQDNTMNTKLAAGYLVAGAFLLPIAGHAADSIVQTPKAFVKDSAITTKIKADLAEAKLSSLVRISVDTDDQGMVSLGGTATSKESADKAVAIARAVKGVTSVKSHIKVVADK